MVRTDGPSVDSRFRLLKEAVKRAEDEALLCIRVHSKLYSMQALTEEQGESCLCLLPQLSQNRRLAVLLEGLREEDALNSTPAMFIAGIKAMYSMTQGFRRGVHFKF